jgi:hypothetical protein
VITGMVECDGTLGSRFTWIARWPTDSVEFMKTALEANGRTPESKVVVLADGLKSILQAAIQWPPRSILEWFHISTRLRHVEQMAPKVASVFWDVDSIIASTIEHKVPRIRHQMWNGKWQAAMHRMRVFTGKRVPLPITLLHQSLMNCVRE